MKHYKIIIILTTLLILFGLVGCGIDSIPEVSGLKAEPMAQGGAVFVSWNDPGDVRFKEVIVTYTNNGTTFNETVLKNIMGIEITGLNNGEAYTFTVKTVLTSGDESEGLTATATPGDSMAPFDVFYFGATPLPEGEAIALVWAEPTNEDFAKVIITYAETGGTDVSIDGEGNVTEILNPIDTIEEASSGSSTAQMIISPLTNNTEYAFKIVTVDVNGNESDGKFIVETAKESIPPGPVTGLSADSRNTRVLISWNDDPIDEDFDHVEITYHLFGEDPYDPIDTVTIAKGVKEALIEGLTNYVDYEFWIKTVDAEGNKQYPSKALATPRYGGTWVKYEPNAWSERKEFPTLAFEDPADSTMKLWVLGGNPNNNEVWKSPDGENWEEVTTTNIWAARHAHQAVVFDGKMWILGGKTGVNTNEVYYSADGVDWTQAPLDGASSIWEERYQHEAVVFDNKIWVIGGRTNTEKDDVWFTTGLDGENELTWTQALPASGSDMWAARRKFAAVAYDNKIWVLGGNVSGVGLSNDVWYTEGLDVNDELTWVKATDSANWAARAYFEAVVYDNKMWILGGYAGQASNDVWYSDDDMTGANWVLAADKADYSERSDHSSAVMNNKLWILGGDLGASAGQLNDVWMSE